MRFPAANRRVLDEAGDTAAPTPLEFNQARGALSATNCTFEWWDAVSPFDRLGVSPTFVDCEFERIGDAACAQSGLAALVAPQLRSHQRLQRLTRLHPIPPEAALASQPEAAQVDIISTVSDHHAGYALGSSASLSDGGESTGLLFARNSVKRFNSFVGITPGLKSTIEYNEFAYQTPSVDGAAVRTHGDKCGRLGRAVGWPPPLPPRAAFIRRLRV